MYSEQMYIFLVSSQIQQKYASQSDTTDIHQLLCARCPKNWDTMPIKTYSPIILSSLLMIYQSRTKKLTSCGYAWMLSQNVFKVLCMFFIHIQCPCQLIRLERLGIKLPNERAEFNLCSNLTRIVQSLFELDSRSSGF